MRWNQMELNNEPIAVAYDVYSSGSVAQKLTLN